MTELSTAIARNLRRISKTMGLPYPMLHTAAARNATGVWYEDEPAAIEEPKTQEATMRPIS